jgi:hypothetical protein
MILADRGKIGQIKIMEIYAISFLVFVVFALALALGLLLGRGPIRGSCRPVGAEGSCTKNCSHALTCRKRRPASETREIW